MRGYLIDVENGKHGPVEVKGDDHLEQFYRLIGCRCIDIAVRKVGETYYNVVLDDEGLLVADPITSAIDRTRYGMLAGNLVLFGMKSPKGCRAQKNLQDFRGVIRVESVSPLFL